MIAGEAQLGSRLLRWAAALGCCVGHGVGNETHHSVGLLPWAMGELGFKRKAEISFPPSICAEKPSERGVISSLG